MIFGFNTDIKHEDTIYHVQSEAREGEMLLQTQVFVRGRCIGKRATPYPQQFTDQHKEQILRDQHRLVLDSIRDGLVEHVLDKRETPESLAAEKELDIQWLNAESVHAEDKLSMKLRATEAAAYGNVPCPVQARLLQSPLHGRTGAVFASWTKRLTQSAP